MKSLIFIYFEFFIKGNHLLREVLNDAMLLAFKSFRFADLGYVILS